MQNVAGYTVIEHYAVFRGQDETHPAAEMLVKTEYARDAGKSFTILSQSGSSLLRSEVLGTLLNNEKRMSQPGNVGAALIDSENYQMRMASNSRQQLDGRDCLMIELTPKRNSPYLFKGTLWVDATDYSDCPTQGNGVQEPLLPDKCSPGHPPICECKRIPHGNSCHGCFEQQPSRPDHREDRLQGLSDRYPARWRSKRSPCSPQLTK